VGYGVTPAVCCYSSQPSLGAARSGIAGSGDGVVRCCGGSVLAGGDRGRGCGGGLGMLGGCHSIDPPRCGFHYAPGWGDVKGKQRGSLKPQAASCKPGRSCEPRATSFERGEEKPQAQKKLQAQTDRSRSRSWSRVIGNRPGGRAAVRWVVGVRCEGVRGMDAAPGPGDGTYGTHRGLRPQPKGEKTWGWTRYRPSYRGG